MENALACVEKLVGLRPTQAFPSTGEGLVAVEELVDWRQGDAGPCKDAHIGFL